MSSAPTLTISRATGVCARPRDCSVGRSHGGGRRFPRRTAWLAALAAVVLVTVSACRSSEQTAAGGAQASAAAAKPTPQPKAAQASKREYFSGAHILVAYKGARHANPSVTRTKEEAQKLAAELSAKLRKDPKAFADEAKRSSDGPSGPFGGDLGTWERGRMIPAFQAAIEKLAIGEISEPVETPFGFHVLKRLQVPPDELLAASQLLVTFKGAHNTKPSITRTKEQAKQRATELVAKLRAKPETFAEEVKKSSDGFGAAQGGILPAWSARSSRVPPVFTRTVRALKVGQISDPIETPVGYYIFHRVAPPPQFAGSHILIAYKGALRAQPQVTRSKAEAKQLATKLTEQVSAAPDKLEALAREHSDGPSKSRGGYLGVWRKGMMAAPFDQAVEQLKVGQVTKTPVETQFGYHIIRRDPLPKEQQ